MSVIFWHSPAALIWLQTLLHERFGHLFELKVLPGCSRIALSLQGKQGCITLLLDGGTYARSDSDLPCAVWLASSEGWPTAILSNLPAPGAVQLASPLIRASDNGWDIGYDILGLTYWMLTRQEEVGRTDLDCHERFPALFSHAFKHGYLERPIVDEWLHVLGQVIVKTWPAITIKRNEFSIKVSHDVDRPSLYAFKPWKTIARMMVGNAFKRRNLKACFSAPWIKLTTIEKLHYADPYNTFDWLINLSKENRITSAFYFICGGTSDMDADYEIEDPIIQELLKRIHSQGHEIGLHPSYKAVENPELIKKEANRLRRALKQAEIEQDFFGGRMHYLRWKHPDTLQALENSGLRYDSTLSYPDRPGFRCGTCFEYPAFNPKSQMALKIRIRPLIAMESSVIDEAYLGLGCTEAAEEKFNDLKNKCKKVGGCFTMLWHNSYFLNDKNFKGMYKRLIKH